MKKIDPAARFYFQVLQLQRKLEKIVRDFESTYRPTEYKPTNLIDPRTQKEYKPKKS